MVRIVFILLVTLCSFAAASDESKQRDEIEVTSDGEDARIEEDSDEDFERDLAEQFGMDNGKESDNAPVVQARGEKKGSAGGASTEVPAGDAVAASTGNAEGMPDMGSMGGLEGLGGNMADMFGSMSGMGGDGGMGGLGNIGDLAGMTSGMSEIQALAGELGGMQGMQTGEGLQNVEGLMKIMTLMDKVKALKAKSGGKGPLHDALKGWDFGDMEEKLVQIRQIGPENLKKMMEASKTMGDKTKNGEKPDYEAALGMMETMEGTGMNMPAGFASTAKQIKELKANGMLDKLQKGQGLGGNAGDAGAAGAAAPPAKKEETLEHFLKKIKMTKFLDDFIEQGVETVEDLAYLEEADLKEMGMKKVHLRKLKGALSKGGNGKENLELKALTELLARIGQERHAEILASADINSVEALVGMTAADLAKTGMKKVHARKLEKLVQADVENKED